MKDDKNPEKPVKKGTIPVKQEDGKGSCPIRAGDILKDPAAGGG